jgi:pentatricopeptide repeat protein
MASAGIKPNVRTYTALITALGNASEWDRALSLLRRMRACNAPGGVEPNAYTYSALIKALGEQVCSASPAMSRKDVKHGPLWALRTEYV